MDRYITKLNSIIIQAVPVTAIVNLIKDFWDPRQICSTCLKQTNLECQCCHKGLHDIPYPSSCVEQNERFCVACLSNCMHCGNKKEQPTIVCFICKQRWHSKCSKYYNFDSYKGKFYCRYHHFDYCSDCIHDDNPKMRCERCYKFCSCTTFEDNLCQYCNSASICCDFCSKIIHTLTGFDKCVLCSKNYHKTCQQLQITCNASKICENCVPFSKSHQDYIKKMSMRQQNVQQSMTPYHPLVAQNYIRGDYDDSKFMAKCRLFYKFSTTNFEWDIACENDFYSHLSCKRIIQNARRRKLLTDILVKNGLDIVPATAIYLNCTQGQTQHQLDIIVEEQCFLKMCNEYLDWEQVCLEAKLCGLLPENLARMKLEYTNQLCAKPWLHNITPVQWRLENQ